MTDKTIPADKVEKIAEKMRDHAADRYVADVERRNIMVFADQLAALLSARPLPTLADMTDDERAGCRRMQADVEGRSERYVIAATYDNDADVALIGPDWEFDWIEPECVTPRPDLPRMGWPGTEKPAPTLPDGWLLADHKDHGRVIVTNTTPARYGRVYYVLPSAADLGFDWLFCDPDMLTYIDADQEADQ